ncbi:CheY-like chemotaxis protein [Paucibacter oligotrophus]|uniref:CheY-like chemotaxis protein n=1 Tax=Roseateles oligotrophus TaxID=1769250 RepID=A0A840L7S6_9BURK|nr:response regulator [Roseateles oligotrophus]MBB4842715.1 CheY-like chemotaxis protein [Roseateles oligotrophus]
MQLDPAPQVLYVEDDRINIVLMEEVFRRLTGWQLVCVESGAEAMELLASQPLPSLLLIDMNLPDTNGLALFQQVRALPRCAALRCVALSADDQVEQVQAALQAGFGDYWAKPIDVTRFVGLLRKALPLK